MFLSVGRFLQHRTHLNRSIVDAFSVVSSGGTITRQGQPFIIQKQRNMTMATAVAISAGVVLATWSARWFYRTYQTMQRTARLTGVSPFTYYYRGGFEEKMSRREAALILGVREFSRTEQIKDAHRRIMIANHPDRGGSPYIAMKVNEAKAVLEKK